MCNGKSIFGRIPVRPLSYDKIYEVSRFVGEFSSVDSLPESANSKINDYALVNGVVYIYKENKDTSVSRWEKAPDSHIIPRAKEIIVDYFNHAIYMSDADRNIIKASASADEIIKTVMNQIVERPEVLNSIEVTVYTGLDEDKNWTTEAQTLEEAIEYISKGLYGNTADIVNLQSDVGGLWNKVGNLEEGLSLQINNLIGYGPELPDPSTSPYKFFILTESVEEDDDSSLIEPNDPDAYA